MRKIRNRFKEKKLNNFNLICISIFLVGIFFISTFNLTTSRYVDQLLATDDIVALPVLTVYKDGTKISENESSISRKICVIFGLARTCVFK